MSKFNQSSVGKMKTVNKAGGQAFKISSLKEELTLSVLTSFFGEKKYYGGTDSQLAINADKVIGQDPQFVANLALFAREQLYLRSVSHVLVSHLAHHTSGKPFARKAIAGICKRPDDMTEIMAYYLGTYGKPLPNSLKKGLADAFATFDEYQLAKYNRKQEVTLKDVFRLVGPSAPKGSEKYELYGRLLNDDLAIPYTWETELSAKGNTKEAWEDLIASKRLPYMATLRNLRNIHNSNADNTQDAYDYIANPLAVEHSKQLPFRFYNAYRELRDISFSKAPLKAVSQAMEFSKENLIKMPGRTVLLADVSGSMGGTMSTRGTTTYRDIALLMASMADSISEEAMVGVFGQNFKYVTIPDDYSILAAMTYLQGISVGHATHLNKPLAHLLEKKIKVDRIVVFSDMQAYTSKGGIFWSHDKERRDPQAIIEQYRKEVNPDVWIHSVDLTGYGTTQFLGKNVNLIAGWSEKILDYIMLAEKGMGNLVKEIEIYA